MKRLVVLIALLAPANAAIVAAAENGSPDGNSDNQPGAFGPRLGLTLDAGTADALHLQPGLIGLGGRAGPSPYSSGVFADLDVPLQAGHPVKARLGPLLRIAVTPGKSHHAGIELAPMVAAAFTKTAAEPNRIGFGGYVLFNVMSTFDDHRALDVGFKIETLGLYDNRDVRAGLVLAFLAGNNVHNFVPLGVIDAGELDRLLSTLGVGSQQLGLGNDTNLLDRGEILDLEPQQSVVVSLAAKDDTCFSIGAIALAGADLQIDLRAGRGSSALLIAADRLDDNEPLVSYCPKANEKTWAHILNEGTKASPVAYRVAERPFEQLFPETFEGHAKVDERRLGGQQEMAISIEKIGGSGDHLTAIGLPGAGLVAGLGDCRLRSDDVQPWRLGESDAFRADIDLGAAKEAQCLLLRSVQPTPVRLYRDGAPATRPPAAAVSAPVPPSPVGAEGRPSAPRLPSR